MRLVLTQHIVSNRGEWNRLGIVHFRFTAYNACITIASYEFPVREAACIRSLGPISNRLGPHVMSVEFC